MRLFERYPGNMNFFHELRQRLPPIFTRETACNMIGGIFSPRTLSNFDAAGKGPDNKYHIGKKVAYERDDFLDWLQRQFSSSARFRTL